MANSMLPFLHRQSDQTKRDQADPAPVNGGAVHVSSGGVTTDAGQRSRPLMPVIPVRVVSPSGKEVQTYAFCDSGSSGTFMSEGLAEQLGKPSKPTTISVDTVCGPGNDISSSVIGRYQGWASGGGGVCFRFQQPSPFPTSQCLWMTSATRSS